MANFSDKMANQLTEHGIDLLRVSAQLSKDVMSLLDQVEAELVKQLRGRDLSESRRDRVQNVLNSVRDRIKELYDQIDTVHQADLRQLAQTEAVAVSNVMNDVAGVDLFTGSLPMSTLRVLSTNVLIQGAPSAEWWDRQASDLAFKFTNELRMGMAAGETNSELIARIIGKNGEPGIMDATRRSAEAMVRTSVQTVANQARLETFKQNSDVIQGVQQVSTLDDRTTDICIAYDGQAWDLDGNPMDGSDLPFDGGPPRHWNCRSVLIPITKSWKQLGADVDEIPPATRASMDGQVAEQSSFADWFASRSEAEQNDILGPGRAELYREGKITLTGLLDQRGNPLTLDELRSKRSRK